MYAMLEHAPLVQQHTSNAKRPVDQEEAQQKTKQRKNQKKQKKQKMWDDDCLLVQEGCWELAHQELAEQVTPGLA